MGEKNLGDRLCRSPAVSTLITANIKNLKFIHVCLYLVPVCRQCLAVSVKLFTNIVFLT